MKSSGGTNRGRKLRAARIFGFASLALAFLAGAGILLFLTVPSIFLQPYVEKRLVEGFAASNPGYSMRLGALQISVVKNRVSCDSVFVTGVDSSFSLSVAGISVEGVRWWEFIGGNRFDPGIFRGTVFASGEVSVVLDQSGYAFRCGSLRVSAPDSEIVAEGVEIHPIVTDVEFFEESRFSKTRLVLAAGACRLKGVACIDVLQGENLHARSLLLADVTADVLIDKDKPAGKDEPGPRTPGAFFSSLKDTVGLDSLTISRGNLLYGERWLRGKRPAVLTFDGIEALVTGIASHGPPDSGANIHAAGIFAGGGTVTLAMSIPLSSPQCSLRYSGSLSGMDLRKLNSFVEISDNMRIKTGELASAAFDIRVSLGAATGSVRATYRNLVIASIDGLTGSESGIMNRVSSWIAKNITLRPENIRSGTDPATVGVVHYARKKGDPYIGFAWFALRSGVGNLVGF
jgi:hypothetical protein